MPLSKINWEKSSFFNRGTCNCTDRHKNVTGCPPPSQIRLMGSWSIFINMREGGCYKSLGSFYSGILGQLKRSKKWQQNWWSGRLLNEKLEISFLTMCFNVSLLFKYVVKSRLFLNFLCFYDTINKISQLLVLVIANLARHQIMQSTECCPWSFQFLFGVLMYHQYHPGEFSRWYNMGSAFPAWGRRGRRKAGVTWICPSWYFGNRVEQIRKCLAERKNLPGSCCSIRPAAADAADDLFS